MRALLGILVTTCAVGSIPATGWAAEPTTADGVDGAVARIEVVTVDGKREIRTPEGFLRIEDPPGPRDRARRGSFGTYHAVSAEPAEGDDAAIDASSAPADAPLEAPPPLRRDGMVDRSAPVGATDPCRAQRARYLGRVLHMAGVDVDRPLELLDGLAGPGASGGNLLAGGWVIPGFDPVRPLAWDQELRSLGRELATCEARSGAATSMTAPPPPAR